MRRIIPIVIILLVASAPVLSQEAQYEANVIRTVVIDPGHGGDNLGALGTTGTYE